MFRTRIAASSETASSEQFRKTNAAFVERSLSDLDRALLAPVRAQLDHMAPMALPVLISGEPGTGRSQAARYLHRASAHAAPEMRYVFAAQVDLDLCAEIARPGKAGKRGEARRTILIDGVEDVPAALQPQLSRSIQEGVIHGGPRIIAISQDGPPDHVPALSTVLRTALSGLSIQMPRFAERTGDMGDIASALLPILATRMGIEQPRLGDDALRYIEGLAWTGNLLQMRSVLTGVLAANPGLASIGKTEVEQQIADGAFPEVATADAPVFDLVNRLMETQDFSVSDFEQSLYRTALARAGGNLAAAARSLGLTRAQLAYRLQTKNDTRPESPG
jgi:DNA-binding NtrC family response regulator